MTSNISKNGAIQKAKASVSKPIHVRGFFWQLRLENGLYTHPSSYEKTMALRAQKMIDRAMKSLGLPSVEYKGGFWQDYIKTSV